MAKAVTATTSGTGVWIHQSARPVIKYRVNVRINGFDLCAGEFEGPLEAAKRFFEAIDFLRANRAFFEQNRKKN